MLVLAALATVTAAVGASTASAAASLEWTQANDYDAAASAGYHRTWLGYVTSAALGSNGTQVASGAATGADVTPSSARGDSALFKVLFPATTGSISFAGSPAAATGEIQFSGTVTWTIHDEPVTLTNPTVTLNGDGTGTLSASGDGYVPNPDPTAPRVAATYDGVVFDLDLDGQAANPGAPVNQPGTIAGFPAASWTINADGTLGITGIVPKIATPNTTAAYVFGSSYAAGVGPDRSPNRFGSFAVTVPPLTGPKGDAGSTGGAGPQGPAGPAGKDATVKTIKLKKAVFGSKRVVARITRNGKTYGYAEVKGKKAKLTYVGTLKGTYTLKTLTGKSRKASIKIG